MPKLKQASLFNEDHEMRLLREKERRLAEAQQMFQKLPALLEKQKKENEVTMPPMAEVRERQKFKQFEQNLSRGQIENVLRTQRQSMWMTVLLIISSALMLCWAYRIISG